MILTLPSLLTAFHHQCEASIANSLNFVILPTNMATQNSSARLHNATYLRFFSVLHPTESICCNLPTTSIISILHWTYFAPSQTHSSFAVPFAYKTPSSPFGFISDGFLQQAIHFCASVAQGLIIHLDTAATSPCCFLKERKPT